MPVNQVRILLATYMLNTTLMGFVALVLVSR